MEEIKAVKTKILARPRNIGQITGVKTMVKSLPYHPFVISHLQDPAYSAGYLTMFLNDQEEGD